MMLPDQGVLSIAPPDWEASWTRGDAIYTGIDAWFTLQKLRAEFVPPKRTRGKRGAARGHGAADAFLGHVIAENMKTGAGALNTAIHAVAHAHPELLRHVWPDYPDEPHRIRKHIQRAMRSARRVS
jgi:hypothetical protein